MSLKSTPVTFGRYFIVVKLSERHPHPLWSLIPFDPLIFDCYNKDKNSSLVNPASSIIEFKVPLAISL